MVTYTLTFSVFKTFLFSFTSHVPFTNTKFVRSFKAFALIIMPWATEIFHTIMCNFYLLFCITSIQLSTSYLNLNPSFRSLTSHNLSISFHIPFSSLYLSNFFHYSPPYFPLNSSSYFAHFPPRTLHYSDPTPLHSSLYSLLHWTEMEGNRLLLDPSVGSPCLWNIDVFFSFQLKNALMFFTSVYIYVYIYVYICMNTTVTTRVNIVSTELSSIYYHCILLRWTI